MNFIKDLVIPFVGPGCCNDRKCQFYWYEFYHKPIEGCVKWNEFQDQALQIQKFDSNFKIHVIYGLRILWLAMEMLPEKLPLPF